jgi:hypothetical protein
MGWFQLPVLTPVASTARIGLGVGKASCADGKVLVIAGTAYTNAFVTVR